MYLNVIKYEKNSFIGYKIGERRKANFRRDRKDRGEGSKVTGKKVSGKISGNKNFISRDFLFQGCFVVPKEIEFLPQTLIF